MFSYEYYRESKKQTDDNTLDIMLQTRVLIECLRD